MWTPLDVPVSPKQPFTDYTRWRLRDTDDGRHVWDFLRTEDELVARPSSDTDKYWLGLPLVSPHSVIKPSVVAKDTNCVGLPSTPGGEKPAGCCPQWIYILQKAPNERRSLAR